MPFDTKLHWHACSRLCCHVLSLRPGECHDSHLLTHLSLEHMYAAVTLGCCCASQLMTHAATQGMCSTSSTSRTMYICTCVCHICYFGSSTTFLVQKITPSPSCTSTHHLCRATAGHSPGYFVDLLVRERFMTSRMERHPDCPQQALALAVNQCIVRCHTVHGVLNVVRDLLPTFDLVNTSTAMHRTARTSKLGKVSLPGLQHGVASLCRLADVYVFMSGVTSCYLSYTVLHLIRSPQVSCTCVKCHHGSVHRAHMQGVGPCLQVCICCASFNVTDHNFAGPKVQMYLQSALALGWSIRQAGHACC